LKIIVVDDEPVIADTLVEILRGEGCEAIAVSDGASAVKWAPLVIPDAVICDVIMPGMNGIQTAKAILRLIPKCRIILFSGQTASLELLQQAREQGYDFEILAKPINPAALLSVLGLSANTPAREG
jgi:CheY-like chemotaxis protein